MDASGESYCCRSELTSSSSSADMLQNHEDANNPADVIHSRGASLASRKRGSKHGDRISVSEETAVSAVATPTTSAALSNDELHHGHGKFKPNTRFYLAFVAISSLTLAAALDATSLSIALPALTKDLGGDAIQSFWTGTAFFLASSIIMPIFAALSHIFGRKTVRVKHPGTATAHVMLTHRYYTNFKSNGYRLTATSARSSEQSFSWLDLSWAL